jgi:hypothetical protein
MELVFQLDRSGNLSYDIASAYFGHLSQCPAHKEVVAFSWNCD